MSFHEPFKVAGQTGLVIAIFVGIMDHDQSCSDSGTPSRPDWVPDGASAGFATRMVPGALPPDQFAAPRSHAKTPKRARLSIDDYAAGIIACDPMILGRAITLIESNSASHQEEAQQLLAKLLSHSGKSRRIGITGIPGAGKSTFIEAFGCHLTDLGLGVAVLAIDPSSSVHGGSILGDKVRMEKLSTRPSAFIRPSPSG
ncbi:MAG: hypothetical protein WC378_03105, partial [Opitutaceae bacterium]